MNTRDGPVESPAQAPSASSRLDDAAPAIGRRRRLPAELVGLLGALVVFIGVGSYYALDVPPFAPPDEQAHVAYAAALAHGQLPRIDSTDRAVARGSWLEAKLAIAHDHRYREVWVSNHPPLYHLLLAPLLRLADAAGNANLGLVLARYLDVVAASGGVAATYLLGCELAGGVRRVGLAAAAMVALLPYPQYILARAQNDGLAFATVTLSVWAGVRYLRRGYSWGGLALVATAVAAAAATRAVGLLVGLVIAAAITMTGMGFGAEPTGEATRQAQHNDSRRRSRRAEQLGRETGAYPRKPLGGAGRGDLGVRLRHGLVRGAGVLAPTALLVGWFYVRNVVLYGDIGASRYLLARFDRHVVPGGTFHQLWNASLWQEIVSSAVGGTITGGRATHAAPWVLALLALAVVGGAVGLVMALLRIDRSRVDLQRSVSPGGVGLCLATIMVVAVSVAQHVAGGGSPYPRYLFPGLGAAVALVAVGLHRLRPSVAALLPVMLLAGASISLLGPTTRRFDIQVAQRPPRLAVHAGGLVGRSLSLGIAALGLVTLLGALGMLARRDLHRPGAA